MSNRHYIFHKEYYEDFSVDSIRQANDNMSEAVSDDALTQFSQTNATGLYNQCFKCWVTYPGLLLGLGYPHEFGKIAANDDNEAADEAIKLGVSLDFVTGMPVIPGSTIKGVLRSAFRRGTRGDQKNPEYVEYIKELARDVGITLESEASVSSLEAEIFGEWCKDDKKAKEHDQKDRASAGGGYDIFFDAVPIETDAGKMLTIESITPHIQNDAAYNKLKNPKPLKLLKVCPGVAFEFRFYLRDGLATGAQKNELFKRLIIDLGIGAKTNTGFGYMSEKKPAKE